MPTMGSTRALMFLVSLKLIEHSGFLTTCDAYAHWNPIPVTEDVGARLILTPYIESGNITEARRLSEVRDEPFNDDIPSYSGFFTVNKTYNSNLFFWFFPSKSQYEEHPLILWLQGGPGASSLLGIFKEIGPYSIGHNLTLKKNTYSWYYHHSLLFIDNPVGTGFSFTNSETGYATEDQQIGIDLYSVLIQFYTMFPELQEVPLYIAGQSYGGKYTPALALKIHQENAQSQMKINLQGIAVGNGFTDPITLLHYSEYVYQMGLVDTRVYEEIKKWEEKGRKAIDERHFHSAYVIWHKIHHTIMRHSNFNHLYNVLHPHKPESIGEYAILAQQPAVRKAIHVGDAEFSNFMYVHSKMSNTFMKSARPWLEVLIDNYRVLYYAGQMDIIVAYPLLVRMFNNLQFSAADDYKNATRVPWYVDRKLAGYMKSGGNFTEVLVRNSGHMVPMDQPKWAFDLINRFTSNTLK